MKIEEKIERYLRGRFGEGAKLESIERLGEGVHGVGYLVNFTTGGGKERLIMKTLFPSDFGHDHFSDRAQVLLLANSNYNDLERHVKSLDVVGDTPEELVSIGKAEEFYIFMEEAVGEPYFKDLNAILHRGSLTDADRKRALMLADYLADIHSIKNDGDETETLYRRRIRDLIGHGECIMGIIDTYEDVDFIGGDELVSYATESLKWWGKLRDRRHRLCRVHGDYHPGNIWFSEDEFTLLDRSRGFWGEPADDVTCLATNYVHYAIKECGRFEGPFADLFRLFLNRYLEKTNDEGLFEVMQPFFAFRVLVVANPKFYPDDTSDVKKKLINFGFSSLRADVFEVERISDYIEAR